MKKATLLFLALLLTVFTMACNQETSDLSDTTPKITLKDDSSSDFVKKQVFRGGHEAKNVTVNGIRKRPNSSLTRLQINFGIATDETAPGEPPVLADKPPLYEVRYQDSERKLTAIFKDVKWDVSEDKVQRLKDSASIIKELDFETRDGDLYLIITLEEPVSFRVYDRAEPGNITIEMKPDKDSNS